jgi:hypothetical protein
MIAELEAIPEYMPPEISTVNVVYSDTGSIVLIALLCGLSVLLILLWLVAVLEYTNRTKAAHPDGARSAQ